MVKNESHIDLVNVNNILEKSYEREIIHDIYRKEFFQWMEENGFDYNTFRRMFECKRISSIEQNKFNIALRKAKESIRIDLIDSVLYLEESFVKIKKILSFLDDDTKSILKNELSKKYKIEIEKSELWKFLE
jgi:hypothetical protein